MCCNVCCSTLASERRRRTPYSCRARESRKRFFAAVSYNALQCVAVCCSVLQCVAVRCSALQCIAVRCSALQCVAVCRSMLQCVLQYLGIREKEEGALYCVLQCVAVRCSVCCSSTLASERRRRAPCFESQPLMFAYLVLLSFVAAPFPSS